MKRLLVLALFFLCRIGSLHSQLLTWTPDFAKTMIISRLPLSASKGNQVCFIILRFRCVCACWCYYESQHFAHRLEICKIYLGHYSPAAQATSLGNNKWQYSITNIRTFFAVPGQKRSLRIAILFRNGGGTVVQRNADGSDSIFRCMITTYMCVSVNPVSTLL
jgi:hypothetical protein